MLEWIASRIDGTILATWAAGTAYPWINVVHVLGLVLFLGSLMVLDLRMLGAWRWIPHAALERALNPLARTGLVVMLLSGFLLFSANAPAVAGNGIFLVKLLLIAFAILNTALFHWRRRYGPMAALLSLPLWVMVAVLGRLIAYS